MKTYESATLVELGNVSELVLGFDGQGPDDPIYNNEFEPPATFVDVD